MVEQCREHTESVRHRHLYGDAAAATAAVEVAARPPRPERAAGGSSLGWPPMAGRCASGCALTVPASSAASQNGRGSWCRGVPVRRGEAEGALVQVAGGGRWVGVSLSHMCMWHVHVHVHVHLNLQF